VRFFFGRFRSVYRARLEDVLNRLFTPERIQQRVDEIATAIRGTISAESKFRLEKFQHLSEPGRSHIPRRNRNSALISRHIRTKFVELRVRSIRQQLDGKTKDLIIPRLSEKFGTLAAR
jgi:hypothetical protein